MDYDIFKFNLTSKIYYYDIKSELISKDVPLDLQFMLTALKWYHPHIFSPNHYKKSLILSISSLSKPSISAYKYNSADN